MILNIKGISLDNLDISGFGGLTRHAVDVWFHDFAGNIGYSNILHADLMTLYHSFVCHGNLTSNT